MLCEQATNKSIVHGTTQKAETVSRESSGGPTDHWPPLVRNMLLFIFYFQVSH